MSENTTRKSASLGKALKFGFRATYDSLGYVVGASFASFAASTVVFAAMGLIAANTKAGFAALPLAIPGLLVVWLCAVGIFYYANMVIAHEHPTPIDTIKGIRTLIWPAMALFVVDLLISAVLIGDVVFFGLAFKARGGALLAVLTMVWVYLALMWMMMSLYHLPLLVAQSKMQSRPGGCVILRKSFLLAADNPGFTVGLFAVIIAIAVLCALSAVGMALLFTSTVAFLLTSSLRELFVKYGIVEQEPDVIEDKPWKLLN